jgi:fucose 4-O-acetylase-like acetyltransferase
VSQPFLATGESASPLVGAPKARSVGLDLARVLGLTAVVVGHTTPYAWLNHAMVIWNVPVFFVLSGYLWNPTRTLGSELKRRGRTLLVPYAIWMAVSVATCALFPLPERPLLSVLGQAVLGGEYIKEFFGPLWFITAIFTALLVTRLAMRAHPALPWAIGLGATALATFQREWVAAIPEAVGSGLVAVLFICVGMALRRWRGLVARPLLVGSVLAGAPMLLVGLGAFEEIHLKGAFVGTPGVSIAASVVASVGVVLVCEGLEPYLSAAFGRVILTVAGCSYAIFIGNSLLRELYTRLFDFWENGLAMFLACYLGSIALGLLIRATPLKSVLL